MTQSNKWIKLAMTSALIALPAFASAAEISRPSEGGQVKGEPGVVYDVPSNTAATTYVSTQPLKFKDADRKEILDYLKRYNVPPCPAGVSHNSETGCSGTALNSSYNLLNPLKDHVKVKAVAPELLAKLSPLPEGYAYVVVDKDVLIIDSKSRYVADAVTLVQATSK